MRLSKAEQIAIITLALIMSTVITSLVLRSWAAQDQLEKITLERDELMAKLKAAKPEAVTIQPVVKNALKRYEYNILSIERVVDGDTMWAKLDLGFNIGYKVEIRLDGLDTPEKNTPEGKIVKAKVERWLGLNPSSMVLQSKEIDKYGRSLAVITNNTDLSLNDYLIAHGFARKYKGEKKVDWPQAQINAILASKEE